MKTVKILSMAAILFGFGTTSADAQEAIFKIKKSELRKA